MIKVEVQSQALRELPFKDRDGNPVLEQTAWAFFYDRDGNPDNHPRSIAIRMNKGQLPYVNGIYLVHPSSLYVGDFGSVKVSPAIKLIQPQEFLRVITPLVKTVQAA